MFGTSWFTWEPLDTPLLCSILMVMTVQQLWLRTAWILGLRFLGKVWVTPSGKPLKSTEVLARSEGNLEGIQEENDGYQLLFWDQLLGFPQMKQVPRPISEQLWRVISASKLPWNPLKPLWRQHHSSTCPSAQCCYLPFLSTEHLLISLLHYFVCLFHFCFCFCHRIFFPLPGTQPRPTTVKGQNLNPWMTREFPNLLHVNLFLWIWYLENNVIHIRGREVFDHLSIRIRTLFKWWFYEKQQYMWNHCEKGDWANEKGGSDQKLCY